MEINASPSVKKLPKPTTATTILVISRSRQTALHLYYLLNNTEHLLTARNEQLLVDRQVIGVPENIFEAIPSCNNNTVFKSV